MRGWSLVKVLYLLGFSGFDVKELQDQAQTKVSGTAAEKGVAESDVLPVDPSSPCCVVSPEFVWNSYYPPGYRLFLVRIRGDRNDVRTFAALLRPLLPYCEERNCLVRRIQHVSLASGNALLGLELVLSGTDPLAPLKDLLFES